MKHVVACLISFLGFVAVTNSAHGQDPVAPLLATAKLSTLPAVYQSEIQPGSLVVLRDKGRAVAYEEASDLALTFLQPSNPPKPASTITLGQNQLATAKDASIWVRLAGYEPGAAFTSGTQLAFNQVSFTGAMISGKQMKKLIRTDPETIENVKDWLLNGFHVYLVEGVFGTPRLDVIATNAGGPSVALGGEPSACSTTAPALPPIPGPQKNTSAPETTADKSKADQTEGSSNKPTDKKTTARSSKTSSSTTSQPSADDGTVSSGGAAVPVQVKAKLCHGATGQYSLDSPTPVNIALKLQELHYYPDPTDKNKSLIDYEPVTVAF